MKAITNWRNATTFDIEADGLLNEATLFHVLSFHMANNVSGSIEGTNRERLVKFLNYHMDNGIPVVAHNGICFDTALCEKLLGIDLSRLMVIDTLAISWYLNTDRDMHGLGSFLEDYGIEKPEIDNWDDLSYEEYKFRCEEDVKINVALWEDMKLRLIEIYTMTKHCIDTGMVNPRRMSKDEVVYLDRYKDSSTVDEYIDRLLTFLMFKMDCARLQEKTKWLVDEEYLIKSEKELGDILIEARGVLEELMPPVAEYGTRTKPSGDPNKKDGSPKVQTVKWNEAIDNLNVKDKYGNELTKVIEGVDNKVKVIKDYKAPNANSNTQLKDLFFSYGWVPQTFKYVKDKEATELWVQGGFKKSEKPIPRKIPQISVDGDDGKELCPSILLLAEDVPELLKYDRYTMVKHRHDTIKGFIRDIVDGKLMARIGGFTNCLTADSVVITNRGSLLIGEVSKGDKVLTHEGIYKEVIDTIDNGVKEVYRVTMQDGREIKCTYNHKFWDGYEWVMAQDLVKGKSIKVYGQVESWEEVKDSKGYKVSSWGRIMNPTGSIKKLDHVSGKKSYITELEWVDGVRRCSVISRLVLKHFVGDSDLHVLHRDGNAYNNNIQNLYYGSDSDNREDAKLHGTHTRATRDRSSSKLTHSQVEDIKLLSSGGCTGKDLAGRFGISTSMVSMIINGKRWSEDLNEDNLYVEEFGEGVVESVVVLNKEPTFDISVEGLHSYVANGFVVHNTLRVKHREIVNLVGVDKPYGENIRGALTCEDDEILLGSDLSSLEDRTKHHFMLPHDPKYVETMMADDYDPHILTAHSAGMVSDDELKQFKLGTLGGAVKEAVAKARKGGKTTNYACLPVDNTEVLTKSGWRFYQDLSIGDEVVTYNTTKDCLEVDTILKTHFFKDSLVTKMENKHWSIESTPDHRWYGWQRRAKGHTRTNNLERYKEFGFRTTNSLNSEFNIITSSKFVNSNFNSVTNEEAAFMGWLLSDGYYKWSIDTKRTSSSFGNKRAVIGIIAQAKHKFHQEVKDCLDSVGAKYRVDEDNTGIKTSPVLKFNLTSPWLREFLDRVVGSREDKHNVDWVSWLLGLSDTARDSFLYTFWLADGDTKGNFYNKNMRITQNVGNICDAVELAMFFTGKRVSRLDKDSTGKCKLITQMSRGYVTAQELSKSNSGIKDVFCLTTDNSTFVIRQNDTITITGNCVYGGSPEAISKGGGIDLDLAKQLHEGYWKLNWSVKTIADEQCVFEDSKKQKWLINPINGFCYSLRTEKDRFSTLAQGTGSFFFDMWIDNILEAMFSRFKTKKMTGSFHDEAIICFKDSPKAREVMYGIVNDSINKVNTDFLLRRDLGCDIQFGRKYSEIH